MRRHWIAALTLTAVLAAGSAQGVVINEFYYGDPGGAGNDEWIELFNLSGMDIDLANWQIAVAYNSGFVTTHTITTGRDTGTTIPSLDYFLIMDGAGNGEEDETGINLNLPRDTGSDVLGIRLIDDAGTSIDTVLYAPAAPGLTNTFNLKDDDGQTTLSRVLLVSGNMGYTRDAFHTDTNDSSVDFAASFPLTPTPVVISRFRLE